MAALPGGTRVALVPDMEESIMRKPCEGERDVSVCFVDLRGYTRHAEANAPTEVSRFLSEYFRVVGEVVREHGGTVVELQGDGVVVAFGALEDVAEPERTALQAACEILRATRALGIVVRVGVATGACWVGHLCVLDRRIFCVLGAPTVLAARLQRMAEELDTSLVADERTLRAAGEGKAYEPHHDVTIRGSDHRHDVYALREAEERAQPVFSDLHDLLASLLGSPGREMARASV